MKLFHKYVFILFSIVFIYSCSTEDVTVGLATELGSFNVPAKQLSNAPFELTPPTSSRAGSFSYQSSNTDVAVINGSTVTIVGVGTTTITAIQSDYQKYAEVSTTANFTVTEFEPPTLGVFTIPTKIDQLFYKKILNIQHLLFFLIFLVQDGLYTAVLVLQYKLLVLLVCLLQIIMVMD